MKDSEIIEPFGSSDTPLVMLISPSPVYRETISTYLLDATYRVAGPFETVDAAHAFFRRTKPDLIVFDAITTQSELISFSQILKEEGQEIPIIVIQNTDGMGISHTLVDYIFPPINPIDLQDKITNFLGVTIEDQNDDRNFITFINTTIDTILRLTPEFGKVDMKEIIRQSITDLEIRNSEVATASQESLTIRVSDYEGLDTTSLSMHFMIMLQDIIEKIDHRMEADWGASLIEDALETVTINLGQLPEVAIPLVEEMGKGYDRVIKKLKHAVPDHDTLDKNVIVVKLVLTDNGPELADMFSTAQEFEKDFNVGIASQLITLVGQGSNYHQGIYGPLPIPRSDNIIAILWSKMLESDIKDIRMDGRTLVVIAVGFRQEIINLIPGRDVMEKIFDTMDHFEHEKEIDKLTLSKIAELFRGNLP